MPDERIEQTLFVTDDAIQRAVDNANAEWRQYAWEAIRFCARNEETFTSDEVIEYLDECNVKTHNLAALGGLFKQAQRDRIIKKTGMLRASKLSRRHRTLTVWEGTK